MLLPDSFETDDDFLEYCDSQSQTKEALFFSTHINYILELAGLKPRYNISNPSERVFAAIHDEEMKGLLDRIKKRRNSIECISEEFGERKEGYRGNIVCLDDHR